MMRRRVAVGILFAGLVAGGVIARSAWSATSMAMSPSPIHRAFEAGVDSLLGSLAALDSGALQGDSTGLRRTFRAARAAFKHQEALLWMFAPTATRSANGPLEDDDESPPHALGSPAAFQRIEDHVFSPVLTADDRGAVREDVAYMREAFRFFRAHMDLIDVGEADLLDASRIELARVSTLTVAGFDSDASGDAIVESAESLEGVRAMASVAARARGTHVPLAAWQVVDSALGRAVRQLRTNTRPGEADHFIFLTEFARPAGEAILRARELAAPLDTSHRHVWSARAATVFDRNAFDAFAYAPDYAVQSTPEVVALGERLFNDPRLSGPSTRSCATCHLASAAFADTVARSAALSGRVTRNTPALANAALQPVFFHDARALRLEDQVAMVLASPAEMASSVDLAVRRITSDAAYRKAFSRVFPPQPRNAITASMLKAALAAYVRSLVSLDSRFDDAMRGNAGALSPAERRGFNLFMGKGRCGTCHFAPLFSGTMPPSFTSSEPEIIGAAARPDTSAAAIDPDNGVGGVDGIAQHMHAFKVPTLRNVARTAPYMHNGAYATLEQVVDFYNRGGGLGVGAGVTSQTLSRRPLGLSAAEQRDVIAFLGSLSDRPYSSQH